MLRAVGLFLAALGLGVFLALNWAAISNLWIPKRHLVGLEMVDIKPGNFNLTILLPNAITREYYTKSVSIKMPFQISRYEITVDQWNLCFEDGGCPRKAKLRRYQNGKHPMTRISWLDAFGFTKWLSKITGETYRLPTEEEWSYVAGSGTDITKKTIEDLIDKRQMAGTTPLGRFKKTRKSGAFEKTEWSVFDMTGTVWEWTLTCKFGSDEESRKPWTVEQMSDVNLCPNRIVQGEERAHVPFFVNEVFTGGCGTGTPVDHIGFRVLKELR